MSNFEDSQVAKEIRNAKSAADARDWLGWAVVSLCAGGLDDDRIAAMLKFYRQVYVEVWGA